MATTGPFRVKIVLYKGGAGRDHHWTSSPTLCANTDVNVRAPTIPHPLTALIKHTTLFQGTLYVSKETTNSRWPRLTVFTLPVYLSKIQDNYCAMLVEMWRFLDLLMTRLRGKIFLIHYYVCGLMFSGQSVSNVQYSASFCGNPKLPCVILIRPAQNNVPIKANVTWPGTILFFQ